MGGIIFVCIFALSKLNNTKNTNTMKTFKASNCEWREKVLQSLNMQYTIINNMIVVKGTIGEYKTLIDLLVSERKKLGILPY